MWMKIGKNNNDREDWGTPDEHKHLDGKEMSTCIKTSH